MDAPVSGNGQPGQGSRLLAGLVASRGMEGKTVSSRMRVWKIVSLVSAFLILGTGFAVLQQDRRGVSGVETAPRAEVLENARPIVGGGSVSEVKIAADADALHVAWIAGGKAYTKSSEDGGETFGASRVLSAGVTAAANLSLSSGSDQPGIVVAFDALGPDGGRGVYAIALLQGAWTPLLSAGPGARPQAALRGSTVYLSFAYRGDDGFSGLVGLSFQPSQERPAAETLFALRTPATEHATLVLGRKLHVVWAESSPEEFLAYAAVDLFTRTVETPRAVAPLASSLEAGSLRLLGQDDRLQAVWTAADSSLNTLYSPNGGRSWTETPAALTGQFPRAADATLGPDSRLRAAWESGSQLTAATFDLLEGWDSAPLRFTDSPGRARAVTVTADRDGRVYAAWIDDRVGPARVYFDADPFLLRADPRSLLAFASRIDPGAYATPIRENRDALLTLLREVDGLAAQSREADALAALDAVESRLGPEHGVIGPEARHGLSTRLEALRAVWTVRDAPGTREAPPDILPWPVDDALIGIHARQSGIRNVQVTDLTAISAMVTWELADTILPGAPTGVIYSLADEFEEGVRLTVNDTAAPYEADLPGLLPDREYRFETQVLANGTVTGVQGTFYTGIQLRGLRMSNLTRTSATVVFYTNLAASEAIVRYGIDSVFEASVTAGPPKEYGGNLIGRVVSLYEYTVTLPNLLPGRIYQYRVEAAKNGDPRMEARIAGTDFCTCVVLSGISASAGVGQVAVSWSTNRPTDAEVRYGLTPLLGGLALPTLAGFRTSHRVVFGGLASNTTYFYQLRSTASTDPEDFAVSAGSQTTPPIRARAIKSEVADTEAWVNWTTEYSGDTTVRYWTDPAFPTTVSDPTAVSDHRTHLTGLASSTTYTFEIASRSASNANDTATVAGRTFTTRGIRVSGVWVSIADTTTTSVIVRWNTSALGDSTVRFGTTSIWQRSVNLDESVMAHVATLTGLLPSTTYRYRVESSHWSNANDTNVSSESTFTTAAAQNDANQSADAGPDAASAMLVDLGAFTAALDIPFDWVDTYAYTAVSGVQVRVSADPLEDCRLDLSLTDVNDNPLASSLSPFFGAPATLEYPTWPSPWLSGPFFLRIALDTCSAGQKPRYVVDTRFLGDAWETLDLDVGSAGDDALAGHLPGFHMASSGWVAAVTDSAQAYAADPVAPATSYFPTYRDGAVNATVYLDLYSASSSRYTDLVLTLQYYALEDSAVQVANGAGWTEIGTVPGRSAWATATLRLDHTALSDALPDSPGLNVALRFTRALRLDAITAIPVAWHTYVGHGSDDTDLTVHSPGAILWTGWVDDGQGYKNATSGAILWLDVPDVSAAYQVSLRFGGELSWFRAEIYSGTGGWQTTAYIDSFSASSLFTTNPAYQYDADAARPGVNLMLRLTANGTISQVTHIAVAPIRYVLDVGANGDGQRALHEPGASVHLNGEWGVVQTQTPPSGPVITYRHANNLANVYLNGVESGLRYWVFVTYRSDVDGLLRQWTQTSWATLGTLPASPTKWSTVSLPTSLTVRDYLGSRSLNLFLEFNGFVQGILDKGLDVDRIWFAPDRDGDSVTDEGETSSYYYSEAIVRLAPAEIGVVIPVEGRYSLRVGVSASAPAGRAASAAVYWDGVKVGNFTATMPWTTTVVFTVRSCIGLHTLLVEREGSGLPTPTIQSTDLVAYKTATEPTINDTDGDGLRDGGEACAYGTDPTVADTDGDNLTDYEEVYTYSKIAAVSGIVNGTRDFTHNITVDAFGFYRISIDRSDAPGAKALGISIVLDGQQRASGSFTSVGTRTVTFDAVLYKGLHTLQVRRSSGADSGQATVTRVSVLRDAAFTTNPSGNDTDGDGIDDGSEVRGLTGWATSPRAMDTDGDGAADGLEILIYRSDPTRADTDGDGVRDGIDLDPIHDLVVQARIREFIKVDDDPKWSYYAGVGVAGNWTLTPSAGKDWVSATAFVYHNLTVNVRDDTRIVPVDFALYRNTNPTGLVDIVDGYGRTVVEHFDLLGGDVLGKQTRGGRYDGEPVDGALTYDIRVFRVSKGNTLLLTPNDWSGVFNGSTGLHRYQAEQRFVFLLFNVTDGRGDLFHADMESDLGPTTLQDTSTHQRALPVDGTVRKVPGWHGDALEFNGVNTSVRTPDGAGLDTLSLTVSLFFRPGMDYDAGLAGSGFYAFAERDGAAGLLWRFGWDATIDGLRFEARDAVSAAVHTISKAAFPLYRGTWYHLAATLSGGQMTIVVDGQILASGTDGNFLPRTGAQYLRIGHDLATNAFLKGTVDEVAVYSSVKQATALGAMRTFVHGANAILVPRGLFYESLLNQTLGGPDSRLQFPALTKVTVQANQFATDGALTLDAYLNGRPIQQVISGNVTLAEAQWFADQLTANRSHEGSAFLLPVHREFYTMGLDPAVIALTPNAVVANSGNFSAPAPVKEWWELIWNAVAGLASAVWNAAVAVAMFFVALALWLVDAVVGLVIGLATGDWTYFQDKVVKPFVEAMARLLKFIVDLINEAIDFVFGPLIHAIVDAMTAFAGALLAGFHDAWGIWTATGTMSPAAIGKIAGVLFGPYFQILLLIGILVVIVLTLATPFLALAGFLVGFLISAIAGFILAGAFPNRPEVPDTGGPSDVARLSNPLAKMNGFMAGFVNDVHGSQGSNDPAFESFLWNLGGAVLSGASFFASLFGLAMTDKTGKAASVISLAGSTLSLTVAIAATLVSAAGQDNYALGVFSAVISGLSLFTSAYSLSKGGSFDVKVLGAISTLASLLSLSISVATLF